MTRLLNFENLLVEPSYLTAIIFELRKDLNETSYVRVLYKNNSLSDDTALHPIQIDGNLAN